MNTKIILVDDEESFNFYHQIVIEDLGWNQTIETCMNGEDVIHLLASMDFDGQILIFLDINMPRMNAWSVLEIIDQTFSHLNIRVVVVSSSIDESDKSKAFTFKSVIDYVEKPVTDHVFQQVLNSIGNSL